MGKNEIAGMAEAILMGFFVPVNGDEAKARDILNYLKGIFTATNKPGLVADRVLELAMRYVEDKTTVITHIGVNVIEDMVLITLPLKTKEEIEIEGYALDSVDGQFCYCYNLTCPDCSELGYSYFIKGNLGYKRVG